MNLHSPRLLGEGPGVRADLRATVRALALTLSQWERGILPLAALVCLVAFAATLHAADGDANGQSLDTLKAGFSQIGVSRSLAVPASAGNSAVAG